MKWCWTACLFLLLACDDSAVTRGALPPERMQEVFYDMMRADELANQLMVTDTTYLSASRRDSLYAAVFSVHGISREQFAKSLDFYEKRPDLMKVMLDSISNKREPARPALVADSTPAPAPVPDSVRRKERRDSTGRNPIRILRSQLPKTE